MLTVGGLFSGIGGIELGLERAGMRVLWHCEFDPYARAVLAERFPGDPCYEDVRELRGADVEPVDVLAGGFPCQDVSAANPNGQGLDGARSGLWSEYARLVGELRPQYVVVENVAALLARGLGRVLGDLAALGYDAEWDCIPASAVGAPHQRDRIWLVAYLANAEGERGRTGLRGAGQDHRNAEPGDDGGLGRGSDWWATEPDVGRVAYGIPRRVDRLRCLGNAVVPQIPEWIGRRILEWEGGLDAAA